MKNPDNCIPVSNIIGTRQGVHSLDATVCKRKTKGEKKSNSGWEQMSDVSPKVFRLNYIDILLVHNYLANVFILH